MVHESKMLRVIPLGLFLATCSAQAQQPPSMPQEHMHHHGDIQPVQPLFPRLGRAQEQPGASLFSLEEALRMAEESNPTLRQAESEIRAAGARERQAGLYPNPAIGYAGDEIRGGSVGGGKQGFFVQQTIVTGGKLGKSRNVFEQEIRLAEAEAEEQKLRVQTAVRIAYYRVLAAQELLDARRDLAQIELDLVQARRQLLNSGQVDETELLESQVDAGRQRLFARMQENTLHEEWRSLAAILGRPELPLAVVAGALDRDWPEINEQSVIEAIAVQSPAVRIADAASARAAAEIQRARSEAIPDLQLRGGLQYNNEPLGLAPAATGWEGLAEVSLPIPVFNRNQGNVAAATAALDRAQLEKQRVALTLRERAASILDEYANAKLAAVSYRDDILPRAKQAYSLMTEKYGQMLAAYPRVLQSRRKLFALQAEYISTLENIWTTGIALQGFLLTDGLEAPAHPAETDRPVRETDIPMPERSISPFDLAPRP